MGGNQGVFLLFLSIENLNPQNVCSAVLPLQRGIESFYIQTVSKNGSTPKKQGDKEQQKQQQLEVEQQPVATQRVEHVDPLESITRLICKGGCVGLGLPMCWKASLCSLFDSACALKGSKVKDQAVVDGTVRGLIAGEGERLVFQLLSQQWLYMCVYTRV